MIITSLLPPLPSVELPFWWAPMMFMAITLSQLESKEGRGEGRTGDWKSTGNLSGVAGDDGEKRRCRFSKGGGVSHRETWQRLVGEGLGVVKKSEALIPCTKHKRMAHGLPA